MKKNTIVAVAVIAITTLTSVFPVCATTVQSTARANAVKFAHKMYPHHRVQVIDTSKLTEKHLENRGGTVIIEKITSYSRGHRGLCLKKYTVYYTRKVSKNQKVVTYAVYNPCSNYTDDVTGVVDTTAPNYIR